MAEELQLRVESKLLNMTLDDLKDVAVKLGIEDSQEGVSKMGIVRTIRTILEKNLGQDEEGNIEYLERVIMILAGTPLHWKDRLVKGTAMTMQRLRRRN